MREKQIYWPRVARRRAMKRFGHLEVAVIGGLKSCIGAISDCHARETDRWLNNRVGKSHQPQDIANEQFTDCGNAKSAKKVAPAQFAAVNHFSKDRRLNRRGIFKAGRAAALAEWRQLCVR